MVTGHGGAFGDADRTHFGGLVVASPVTVDLGTVEEQLSSPLGPSHRMHGIEAQL